MNRGWFAHGMPVAGRPIARVERSAGPAIRSAGKEVCRQVMNRAVCCTILGLSLAAFAAVAGDIPQGMLAARAADEIPFIDAHSQAAAGMDLNEIIPLMDMAEVRRVILSARNDRSPQEIAEFAVAHPERITAAVRTKGKAFNPNVLCSLSTTSSRSTGGRFSSSRRFSGARPWRTCRLR